jgi:phenylacetate-CoA ligase
MNHSSAQNRVEAVVPDSSVATADRVMEVFRLAADRVPAYRTILAEAGVRPTDVRDLDDFLSCVPMVDKASTFGRFPVRQLCLDGEVGTPVSLLTSSGHSGQFSYGVYGPGLAQDAVQRVDDALDAALAVRSRKTLMINCLPMGVGVPTMACTVAQTSVRPDMVTALVREFADSFDQVLIVGEMAFVKHALELGIEQGIDWKATCIHVLVGEEPLAENARTYVAGILGTDGLSLRDGMILSSYGAAEFGLNLFLEAPVWSEHRNDALIRLRRALHDDIVLKNRILGTIAQTVPMCMTYDGERLFLELLPDGELVLTSLRTERAAPLIRYRTGDKMDLLELTDAQASAIAASTDLEISDMRDLPIVLCKGRGEGAVSGSDTLTAEQVKEGLYAEADLVAKTTCNFRITAGKAGPQVRIQLTPGISPSTRLNERFAEAIRTYTDAPSTVQCEPYETFQDQMTLDYERKFAYLALLNRK